MYDQREEGIRVTDMDILCGRGKAYANHPGNLKFTHKIQSNLQRYRDAPKRIDRSIVLATMVDDFFDEGCRFLKKNKATNGWIQLTADQCHEKVGHALRDLHRKTKGTSPPQTHSSAAIAACKKQKRAQHEYQENDHISERNFNLIMTDPLEPAPIAPANNVSDYFDAIDVTPLSILLRYVLSEEESDGASSNLLTEMQPVLSVANRNEINTSAFPDSTILPIQGNIVRDSFRGSGFFDSLDNRHDLTQEDLRNFEF